VAGRTQSIVAGDVKVATMALRLGGETREAAIKIF
jgi:hypothetical protein